MLSRSLLVKLLQLLQLLQLLLRKASYHGDDKDPYNNLALASKEVKNPPPDFPLGHIIFGRNPLKCDCSIKWIVEDPKMLNIIDFGEPTSYKRPKCKDGTYV